MKNKKSCELPLNFDSHELVKRLLGVHDIHIKMIEEACGVTILVRGNRMKVIGSHAVEAELGAKILHELYALLKRGVHVEVKTVEQAITIISGDRKASVTELYFGSAIVSYKGHVISPRTVGQKSYLEAINSHDMVFGFGPAGTGKTFLAMAAAVKALLRREFERIILTRPAVEAGEKLGFLPGNMQEKVNPYLRPLYDALHDMMDIEQARRMIDDGRIEVAPLAFMRGRTLNNAFVILDEGQNCTPEQMKMFLTRLGFNSKAIITADVTQIDLPRGTSSGAVEAMRILKKVPGISFQSLGEADIVRHPLVQAIVKAYDEDATR